MSRLLGRGWLWDFQDEGCDFGRWYYGVAWDFYQGYHTNYKVLAVAIPLNFAVRAVLHVRAWCWMHSGWGPRWTWVGIRHPRELAERRRPCSRCGRVDR